MDWKYGYLDFRIIKLVIIGWVYYILGIILGV